MTRFVFAATVIPMAAPKRGNETGTAVRVQFEPHVGAALAAKAHAEGRRITEIVRQAVGELVLPYVDRNAAKTKT